jgi:sulfate permease, SulP family
VKHPGPATRAVIIDLDANDEIDITSADMLHKLADSLERQNSKLVLAHVHQPVLDVAREAGLLNNIGDDRTFPDIATAISSTLPTEPRN